MRIAVLTSGIPNSVSGGGACVAYGMVESLKRQGNEVEVLALIEYPTGCEVSADGVSIDFVTHKRSVRPLAWVFPSVKNRWIVRKWLQMMRPDVIVAYHWEALAALPRTSLPVVGYVGDPIPRPWIGGLLQWWLLRKCDRSAAMGAQHAREMGIQYLRAPIA